MSEPVTIRVLDREWVLAQANAVLGDSEVAAVKLGMAVNAGHDLTLDNLPPLVKRTPHIAEASIGHAVIADCLIHGMAETVRRYRAALGDADA
mgnify:CR=1 FL=1